MDYTTVGLLADIRRRGSLPTTPSPGNRDADLLAYANELLRLDMAAEIIPLQEGYYLKNKDVALASAGTYFRVPPRAIAGRLRAVQLLDANGVVLGEPLPEISIEREGDFNVIQSLTGYYFENSRLVLVGGASSSATYLRMKYYLRPNDLVQSGYTTITAIDTANSRVTVASTSGFTTSTLIDFVAATPGFESKATDLTPTVVGTPVNTITFAAGALPSDLEVGDYVCLAQQSPVPQVPETCWAILSQWTVVRYLEAQGQKALKEDAEKTLARMKEAAGMLSSPRNDAGSKKVVNRNSFLGWPVAGGGRGRWY